MGGLGLIIARYIATHYQGKLILTGRSQLNEHQQTVLSELEKQGAEVLYLQADVTKRDTLTDLMRTIKERFGALNGVIHSAGVLHDAFILKKTAQESAEVMDPKILGSVYLDEITQAEPLDFFTLFSSISSIFGNVGQCDYAYANGFMDGFAHYREALREQGKRQGKTVAINWPLWRMAACRLMRHQSNGWNKRLVQNRLKPKRASTLFLNALIQEGAEQIVLVGQKVNLEQSFKKKLMLLKKQKKK